MGGKIGLLLGLDPGFGPGDNHPVPILDIIIGQAFCAHLASDHPFHLPCRPGMGMEPLLGSQGLRDPIPSQNLFLLQKGAQLHMRIVQNVARLFQILPALQIEVAGLGHLGEIIGNPLMFERRTRGAHLHPSHDLGGADPGPAQRGLDPGPKPRLGKTPKLARLDIDLRINPALGRGLRKRMRAQPERLHMRHLCLDGRKAFLQRGPLRIRLLGNHPLHPLQLFRIEASQILEGLLLCHVDIS